VRFTIDAKPKDVLYVGELFRTSQMKVKEFDTAYLLKQNTTFYASYYATQLGQDCPALIGVAYIAEPYLRNASYVANINNSTVQQSSNLIYPT